MRRIKHVWEKITSLENIETAIVRASQKKKNRRLVQKILCNRKAYALEIQKMLLDKSFTPTPYIPIKVRDSGSGKIREIGTHVRCSLSDASSVMSYLGITTHCDSYNFMRHYVLPFISIAYCKEVHREACKAIAS